MNAARLWTIARLDLQQRVRSVAWYVMLGVFALVLVGVTALSFLAFAGGDGWGSGVYSTVVYLTLLLVLLVAPTLSGNSINGDRDAATLASVQVTLATTGEIVLGKFVAAWITGLAFVVVAAPFLTVATLGGGLHPGTVAVSLAVLLFETGIVAAIGIGLSGLVSRPLFSVAATYLLVAALSVGTAVGFGLLGVAIQSETTYSYRSAQYDEATGAPLCRDGSEQCWNVPDQMVCEEWTTDTYTTPRFDRVWWMLTPNPFVILTDATPVYDFDVSGYPTDMFGQFKYALRLAQLPPELEQRWDECDPSPPTQDESPQEVIAGTVPSWFVGAGLQIVVAGLLLWGGAARTRTPSRTLPPGTRIA